ncbi:MAG: AmmeMemoRadiSam system protein A [Candidatus Margulisiibacteriota bacterium]
MSHPIVQLARKTIELYLKEQKIMYVPPELTDEMKLKAGVFVSLHRQGALRGCIGTFSPTQDNVAKEVIMNAISAATRDPRFMPMDKSELEDLEISVDVLSSPEPVKDISELDAKKYGIIVSAGSKRGLLLPDLDGVNTPQQQISICRQKAGISEKEPVQLAKFVVKRYY